MFSRAVKRSQIAPQKISISDLADGAETELAMPNLSWHEQQVGTEGLIRFLATLSSSFEHHASSTCYVDCPFC